MKDLLPFLIVGVTSGSLYGLAAVGLVLTFRTSGVFNFAHGAIAAAAAYLFYDLRFSLNLPWPVALLVAVGVVAVVSAVCLERLARALAGARPVMIVLATVGLLLAIQGVITWHYGAVTLAFPSFLPTSTVEWAGVQIQYGQIIVVALGVLLAGGMYWLVQRTELGAAMRGVVDDPTLVALTGRSPNRVRRLAWGIGSAFAALSGVLLAQSLGRDVFLLTLLIVQAFGAAAIGRFTSLPLTYAGGLATGIGAALLTKWVASSSNSVLGGLPASLPFIVLFAVLLFIPKGKLPVQRFVRAKAAEPVLSARSRLVAGVVTIGATVAVPSVVGAKLPVFMNGLVFVVIFASLGLLVWTSGQLSLCHAVFVAVGATSFSHLTTGAGLPWVVALVLAGLAVVPIGAIVAFPAIRLSGIYLALATFGFGVLMQRTVYPTGIMFGGAVHGGTRAAPRPDIPLLGGRTDTEFYFVLLIVAVAVCLTVLTVLRSRLGRVLRALSDSPTALNCFGLNTNVTRLFVFSLSAFLAGIGGALFASFAGQVKAPGFGPLESLLWLAVLALSGTTVLRSAVVAALFLTVLPSYAPDGFANYQIMVFGAAAITVAVVSGITLKGRSLRLADRIDLSPVRERLSERRVPTEAVLAESSVS